MNYTFPLLGPSLLEVRPTQKCFSKPLPGEGMVDNMYIKAWHLWLRSRFDTSSRDRTVPSVQWLATCLVIWVRFPSWTETFLYGLGPTGCRPKPVCTPNLGSVPYIKCGRGVQLTIKFKLVHGSKWLEYCLCYTYSLSPLARHRDKFTDILIYIFTFPTGW